MKSMTPISCRRVPAKKQAAIVATLAMLMSSIGNLPFAPAVKAQTAPVGSGFTITAGDLRFIFEQIQVAQAHAAGGTLLGGGPLQVSDPQLPRGLRTVDGSFNNLVPGQEFFGAADRVFPRQTTPTFRPAETLLFDPDGAGPQAAGQATSYAQKRGFVSDSQPRLVSNLIVDQTAANPAALAAAANPCGEGGFVCGGSTEPDPITGSLFIPNITPDFGLSAPFNLMFTFFGQFFDHGLDLVTKGGGAVLMPLKADDPLVAGPDHIFGNADDLPVDQRFMVMTRATNLPGPDGVLGDNPATPQDESADDVQEAINTTTPWVDQNQTYTSHPSHQVFLREYVTVAGRPQQTGKVADGDHCGPRGTIASTDPRLGSDVICNIANWAQVKAQAANILGIRLTDADLFDVPLILTDPYGHFKPGPLRGMPQIVLPGNVLVEGNTAGGGVLVPATAFRTGHAFLNDIAHSAVPTAGGPDADTEAGTSLQTPQPPGTYDNELLDMHFITGDGRGNENIALTAVHQLFHAEHNRLAHDIDRLVSGAPGSPSVLTPAETAAWHAIDSGSGWDYNERLFQAARFATEMQYQHLVFEEFARKVQPLINPFLGGITSINGAITAEFAHTVYRLGHSMLPEVVTRLNANGTANDLRLFDAFLNPAAFNNGGPLGQLNAASAAGSLVRGLSREVGNELDEFVVDSVRNTLVGLPLDLAAINIARGRSEGIPPLNVARRQFFTATRDTAVRPYSNWFEFGLSLKHQESLTNFVAAYGTDPTITSATTMAAKRAAASLLVAANGAFMFAPAATSGLDTVDFWIGGLAERQAVFAGLLGSTFNFVFEKQLESLQDGDRFYYLQRTDGLNMRFQLEGNSLAELARRNTDLDGTMDVIFNTADFILNVGDFTGTATVDLGDGASLITTADGTKLFFDPLHRGKNIVFNGGAGNDRMQGDIGDDSFFGNGGNDRIVGGEGNDTLNGGDGDDVIFADNGDDVIKGGPGNDAGNGGPGFGADLLIGGDGQDFLVGGDDGVEYFGGPGNDILIDGTTRSEGIFGGDGDDWLDGGDGHDGGGFGDGGNFFDLLAGLDFAGGDDVIDGGPGQDLHFGEGGDDIFLMSEGTNKYLGDYGFDWITQRGWPFAADIELDLFALPDVPLNFNDLRNFYRFVDGASGWNFDDHIRGSSHLLCDPALGIEAEACLIPGMELTAAAAAKISGLTALMGATAFNQPLPFIGGDILLGGTGSDTIEGKRGKDLIDGDVWLNVQLRAVLNDGTVKLVDSARELIDDVFADPQRLNPGNITIVRSIVTPAVPAPDCGAAAPRNCDIAVFRGLAAEYDIIPNANGTVTIVHAAPVGGLINDDGTDTLRNIERIQFADVTITAPGSGGGVTNVAVPNVVGLAQAAAAAVLTGADFVVTGTTANSPTAAIGTVISQNPVAGTLRPFGSSVNVVVAVGALVPNVVGLTQANAGTALTGAGLTVGSITTVNSATAAGIVLSQAPSAGTSSAPGTGVALTISLGPANVIVPNVVNQAQGVATTNLTNAGLVIGTVTTASSATVASGNVISTTPGGGASVAPGSAVNLVVSTGPAAAPGLVAAFGFDEVSGTIAINSANNVFNGAIRQAIRVDGKIGKALSFDGANDWVTVTDTTGSPLDLTTGMTLEAWVKPTAMAGWETIVMKERGGLGTGLLSYALYAHDGAGEVPAQPNSFAGPAGYLRVTPVNSTTDQGVRQATHVPLTLGAWTHIATTYDGANQRLYVNGVLVATKAQAGTIAAGNQPLRIGGNNVSGEFFQGLIDEIRIYSRALSAAEIATDMNAPIVP
jgi:beta-lactam-binding protein with PASTA domain/Ca2+-binding RTX toxin-like protein